MLRGRGGVRERGVTLQGSIQGVMMQGQGGQNYKKHADENVHPNLVVVLLFVHTEVKCGKCLFMPRKWN